MTSTLQEKELKQTCLSKIANFMYNCQELTIDSNVNINYEDIKECEKDKANVRKDTDFEKVENLKRQDSSFNVDKTKQEIPECLSNTDCIVSDNNSYETTNAIKQNDTSYIKEFESFIKIYNENTNIHSYDDDNNIYDNACTSSEAIVASLSKTEEFLNDNKIIESLGGTLDYDNLYANSKQNSPAQNTVCAETVVKNEYIQSTCKLGDEENIVPGVVKIVKPHNASFEIFNKFNDEFKKEDTVANKNEDIISISSESSELTIDPIYIDHCVNHSIFSLSNMEIDFKEFEANSDCEGYNSSDFKFIEEHEACLEGIINKSHVFENVLNNCEEMEEQRINLNEAGPSKRGYGKPEYNKPLSRLYSRSDSEVEESDHHAIPEGESLYELFAEPWAAFDFQAENKAFFSNRPMDVEVNNFGFNVRMLQQRHEEIEVDEAIKQEAKENAQKIVSMYSVENKKRRRRF